MAVAAFQAAIVALASLARNPGVEVVGHGVDQRLRGIRCRSGRFLVFGLKVKFKLWFLGAGEQAVLTLKARFLGWRRFRAEFLAKLLDGPTTRWGRSTLRIVLLHLKSNLGNFSSSTSVLFKMKNSIKLRVSKLWAMVAARLKTSQRETS